MTQKAQLWNVSDSGLKKIEEAPIDYEQQLEDWLAADIAVLDPNLLVIGRQIATDYGTTLDLLCLDDHGDTVVIELKKGKTPREVTAQALDYASWVKELSAQEVMSLAGTNLGNWTSLDEAFRERFGEGLPEQLNLSHRSLIVAESMDASTERIVQYLSDLNVPINIATVQHFKDESGTRILAQVFLIEQEKVEANARKSSRRAGTTVEGLRQMARDNEVGDLWDHTRESVRGVFDWAPQSAEVACQFRNEQGRSSAVLFVGATAGEKPRQLSITFHASRVEQFFGIDVDKLKELLPPDSVEIDHEIRSWRRSTEEERQNARGYRGFFASKEEIDRFTNALKSASR